MMVQKWEGVVPPPFSSTQPWRSRLGWILTVRDCDFGSRTIHALFESLVPRTLERFLDIADLQALEIERVTITDLSRFEPEGVQEGVNGNFTSIHWCSSDCGRIVHGFWTDLE